MPPRLPSGSSGPNATPLLLPPLACRVDYRGTIGVRVTSELNETQLGLVLEARDLYELLGVDRNADLDTIRGAYRSQSKESHPDLHQGTARESTELMIRLNQAWEILRSTNMRCACDWLDQERREEAVA